MRSANIRWLPPHAGRVASHYPALSERHPTYLFGRFDLDRAPLDRCNGLDEALLCAMAAAQSARCGAGPTHIPHHPAVLTMEAHSFMFGTDPEQPRAMPWGEQLFALGVGEDAV